MALESDAVKNDHVKLHFTTREGKYRQMHLSESFYGKNLQYPAAQQGPASNTTPVKTSFVKVRHDKQDEDCICLTIGRELFYFLHKAIQQTNQPLEFIDKRTYRGVAPTCHNINQFTASEHSVKVAIGFTAGQVQIIDVRTKESLHIMNEDRSVEKSRVTCVRWYPESDRMLLTSHINGVMYTYDVAHTCTNVQLTYHSQPVKSCAEYEVYSPKVKPNSTGATAASNSNNTQQETSNGGNTSPSSTTRNPLYKWIITKDGSAVNTFKFSPCGRYLAVVTQNGYLRVFEHSTFELVGSMKSYFGGLTACDWSPDGRFIATGGEDDLVTVWSFLERSVVSRGTGHSSWITDLAFDPFCCEIPSDEDVKVFYEMPSVGEMSQQVSTKLDCVKEVVRCNGDCSGGEPPLPSTTATATTSSMRRLRTYSNVSKLSRLSLGLDSSVPTLSYRFGSVGQDSQLCLWELDHNALTCAREKRDSNKKLVASRCNESEDNVSEETCGNSSASVSSSASAGVKNNQATTPTPTAAANNNNMLQVNNPDTPLRSLSNPLLQNVKKKKNGSTSGGWPSLGKFATLGSAQRRNSRTAAAGGGGGGGKSDSSKKEHKRNASLPYFGFKTSSSSNHASNSASSSSSSKFPFNKKTNSYDTAAHQQPRQVELGSELCPRIDETTMLEPLVCKKIAVGRLTGIDFKYDGIVTTCQDGFIQLWRRPMKAVNEGCDASISSSTSQTNNSSVSSPSTNNLQQQQQVANNQPQTTAATTSKLNLEPSQQLSNNTVV